MKNAWPRMAFKFGRSFCSLLLVVALLTAPCLGQSRDPGRYYGNTFGQGRDPGRYSNAVDWEAESNKMMKGILIAAGLVAGLFLVGGIFNSFSKSPDISIDPSHLDFGKLNIGNPVTRDIQLVNKSAGPVQVDPPSISGQGFSLANPWENSRVLAKGEQITISVVFTPASSAQRSGLLKAKVMDTAKKRTREFTIKLAGKSIDIHKEKVAPRLNKPPD